MPLHTITPVTMLSSGFTKYTVEQSCGHIFLREQGGVGSTGYTVQTLDAQGNPSGTYTRRMGEEFEHWGVFNAGDKPLQIQVASGSPKFDGYESDK